MAFKQVSPIIVAEGGTGAQTFTAYSVICAGTTATGGFQNVSGLGSATQVLTSNGPSALPTWENAGSGGITTLNGDSGSATGSTVTIAGGTGITTVASGSTVTINASGSSGFTWSVITANQNADVNNGYICNKGSLLTLTLPTTSAVGDLIEVSGMNTNLGWKIAQNASQQIHFGLFDTTSGTGGSLASTLKYDSVRIVCNVANLEWIVISSIGNITVV